jgi:vancomycin resistance protein YoaR
MAQPTTTSTQQALHQASTVQPRSASSNARGWFAEVTSSLRDRMTQPSGTGRSPDATQAPSRKKPLGERLLRIAPRFVAGTAAVLLLLAIGLLAFRLMFDDRIYPAVVVGDVNVGGLTIAQAEDRLASRASELEASSISFTYNGQTWTPTLSEIGATIETDSSLAEARRLGREDNAVSRLQFTGSIIRSDQTVPLRTELNLTQLNAWFDKVDADIGQPAVDATVIVEGTSVSITPDATGIVVDRDAAKAQILNVLETLQPVKADLPTVVDEPELRQADLEAEKSDVERVLSKPVRVEFEAQSWRIEAETISQYLTVETTSTDGQPDVQLAIDTAALTSMLRETYSGEINRKPSDAQVAWSDESGLIALEPSVDGVTLKAEEFSAAVAESFLGGHDRVDIPVHITKPQIDSNNLAALKIETRLGRGDSNYEGGTPERDANIEVGVRLLNGTLVPPGQDFSFNGAIGEITAEKGYLEASVVVGERVGRDIGGGICQVSTTVFRAALLAGFPMPEWWPHTYRIPGYEKDGWGPGYDASILQLGSNPEQWADYKFTNTTDGWLLVEAWTSYPHVIVNIYGQNLGWDVQFSDEYVSEPIKDNEDIEVVKDDLPPGTVNQTEWPLDGLEAGFNRTVVNGNGEVVEERYFATYFKGRGNVYEVSPDMAGQSPASQ